MKKSFRLDNFEIKNEIDPQLIDEYIFNKKRKLVSERTFCLLDWLTGCEDYEQTCRNDQNCDIHTKGTPCGRYGMFKGCSCDRQCGDIPF